MTKSFLLRSCSLLSGQFSKRITKHCSVRVVVKHRNQNGKLSTVDTKRIGILYWFIFLKTPHIDTTSSSTH